MSGSRNRRTPKSPARRRLLTVNDAPVKPVDLTLLEADIDSELTTLNSNINDLDSRVFDLENP